MPRCFLSVCTRVAKAQSSTRPAVSSRSLSRWRVYLPQRSYSTAYAEDPVDEQTPLAQIPPELSSGEKALRELKNGFSGSVGSNSSHDLHNLDEYALNLIVAGHGSQPERTRSAASRTRSRPERSRNVGGRTRREGGKPDRLTRAARKTQVAHSRPREAVLKRKASDEMSPVSPTTVKARRTASRARVAIRTKYVQFGYRRAGPPDFSSGWNSTFAKLQRKYDKTLAEFYHKPVEPPNLDPRAVEWVEQILEQHHEGKGVQLHHVAAQHGVSWRHVWRHAMLWILFHSPEDGADFLRATHVKTHPPAGHVEDVLQYLAKYYSEEKLSSSARLNDLIDVTCLLMSRKGREVLTMDRSTIRLLLPHCNNEQIKVLYHSMRVSRVQVHWNTLLHIATAFADHDMFERALEVMLDSAAAGAEIKSVQFKSSCAKLLRKAMDQPEGLRISLRIVDNLVKIGLQLNIQLCNILILNAVEAGDIKTAFSVYHSLVEHGVKADEYTYAILLKGCKGNIDDAETLNATIRATISGVEVLRSPVLATEILHCLTLHHMKHHPENAFKTVVEAYLQLFSAEPLVRLGLLSPDVVRQSRPLKQPLPPSPQAMAIMFLTFLRQPDLGQNSYVQVTQLYQNFREAVLRGDRSLSRLAETDHVHNMFLMRFTQSRSTLVQAAEVVRDMQRSLPEPAKATQCAPTKWTWSVFLHGFARHKQMKLAEQVLGYMRSKGIEPSRVTWNMLVAGYAKEQNVDGTISTLKRLEESGEAWDEWTLGGLNRLRDREKDAVLQSQALRKQRWGPEPDFTDDIKLRLAQRLSSSDPSANENVDGFADSELELASRTS